MGGGWPLVVSWSNMGARGGGFFAALRMTSGGGGRWEAASVVARRRADDVATWGGVGETDALCDARRGCIADAAGPAAPDCFGALRSFSQRRGGRYGARRTGGRIPHPGPCLPAGWLSQGRGNAGWGVAWPLVVSWATCAAGVQGGRGRPALDSSLLTLRMTKGGAGGGGRGWRRGSCRGGFETRPYELATGVVHGSDARAGGGGACPLSLWERVRVRATGSGRMWSL